MKLIVLYGPKDSGKTTTLKIVYGKLKPFDKNLQLPRFEYLDKNTYLDFADVLALAKTNVWNKSVTVSLKDEYKQYDENTISDFDETYQKDERNKSDDEYNSILLNMEQQIDELFDKPALSLQDNDRLNIGFVLEGDYGCTPKNADAQARSLYKNLEKFKDCDIIICACSAKDNISIKPAVCVKKFVEKYHAIAYIAKTRDLFKNKKWTKTESTRFKSCEMEYAYNILMILKTIM
ncbi:MAG: hypothetical protein IKP73_11510 [Bacteroidales bacterium]|nr:hypothetical protein [Bacteroidales bacterium]